MLDPKMRSATSGNQATYYVNKTRFDQKDRTFQEYSYFLTEYPFGHFGFIPVIILVDFPFMQEIFRFEDVPFNSLLFPT